MKSINEKPYGKKTIEEVPDISIEDIPFHGNTFATYNGTVITEIAEIAETEYKLRGLRNDEHGTTAFFFWVPKTIRVTELCKGWLSQTIYKLEA